MLSSLPVYYLSLFKIPEGIAKEIEKLQASFLWGGAELKRKVHLVRWDEVTKSTKQGGLSVRRIRDMNVCLLMKWWWRYANEEQAQWKQVLVCKYKAEGGHWRPDIHSGGRVSKIWGDILGAANQNVSLLQFYINNLQIRVGNGCRVSFWHDCWTGGASLKESFTRLFRLSNEKDGTLRDYAVKRGNSENWVISFRRALFQWEQEELLNLNLYTRPGPVLNLLVKDRVLWLASKSGQSFVSTCHVLNSPLEVWA